MKVPKFKGEQFYFKYTLEDIIGEEDLINDVVTFMN